jgi:hypothetical protein
MENKIDSAYADIGEFFGKISVVGHNVFSNGD